MLELGTGTGRVADALHRAGIVRYVGVESSSRMIAALRARDGCAALDIVHGDFSVCVLPGPFELIFALTSTFHLLASAERQAAAFRHLAAHLSVAGTLLIECNDPIDAADRGRTTHRVHHIDTARGIRPYPVTQYASARDELDAMAGDAGLSCAQRWSDWSRRVDPGAVRHISLYRRRAESVSAPVPA